MPTITGMPSKHTFLLNFQGNESIIHIDLAANINNFGEIFVVHPKCVLIALLHKGIVQGHFQSCTFLKLHFCCTTLEGQTTVTGIARGYPLPSELSHPDCCHSLNATSAAERLTLLGLPYNSLNFQR